MTMDEREETTPCDIDDVICQAGILRNLKELKTGMGRPSFEKQFPEFNGFDEKLSASIRTQIATLRTSLQECGNIEESDLGMGESLEDDDGELDDDELDDDEE